MLDLSLLRRRLQNSPIGARIHHYERIPSTMSVAHGLVDSAERPALVSGSLVIAEEQTAGRGRRRRRWMAPPGRSVLASFVIAGQHLPSNPAQLPLITGLAVLHAVRDVSPVLARHLWLKWPNDLLVLGDGAVGKLAGMLIESRMDNQGTVRYAILGIGINVNQRRDELPDARPDGMRPASLRSLLSRDVSRENLLVGLCGQLNHFLCAAEPASEDEIHKSWQDALLNLNRPVIVNPQHEQGLPSLRGYATSTTLNGALVVETEDGEQHIVDAGDVAFGWPSMT